MKKTEAIDLIEKILGDHYTPDESVAEVILDRLVEAGMLPPEYKKKMTRDLGDGLVVQYDKNIREWEEVKPS